MKRTISMVLLVCIMGFSAPALAEEIDWCKKCREMETFYFKYCMSEYYLFDETFDGQTPEEFCKEHTLIDVLTCSFDHGIEVCEGTKDQTVTE